MRQFYKNNDTPIPAIAFEETAPEGFTLITDPIERKRLFSSKYDDRRTDGLQFYNDMQAELYIGILDGVYTEAQVLDFQAHTKELGEQISEGSWLTGKTSCQNLAISGIFDTAKKDQIQLEIDTYLNDNY